MHRVLFVCHGNICRSTMAQFVMEDLARRAGREDEFIIDSAATSREELGNPPHPGTVAKLREAGVPVGRHRARQMTRTEYANWDHIVYMDEENAWGLERILRGDPDGMVSRLLDWTDSPRDVADPWYTGDFDATYEDVLAGCEALLAKLQVPGLWLGPGFSPVLYLVFLLMGLSVAGAKHGDAILIDEVVRREEAAEAE